MKFPERFSNLPEYAFPRLRTLLDSHAPGGEVVQMTIGDPTHDFPAWVMDIIAENAKGFGDYPVNEGFPGLLEAIASWAKRRFSIDLDPSNEVMALNGTREGLFNAAVALCPEESSRGKQPAILVPNPFYQVYAVAAAAIGAEPVFVPATRETGFLPDFVSVAPEILDRTEIAYICSPSNPQGAVASRDYWIALLDLAEKHDFRIFSDECYSEIYRGNDAPMSAKQVASEIGADPERVVIFHSLSKRSNLPGLRSGFVAGGKQSIAKIKQLRTYAGAPLPMPLQHAAAAVWSDEDHVTENRQLYRQKYELADRVFEGLKGYHSPQAGFFLWLPVEDGEAAAIKLWTQTGVRVLPGAYLGRDVNGDNPGNKYIRAALVAPITELESGLGRLSQCLYN